jgi:hypothetical protein
MLPRWSRSRAVPRNSLRRGRDLGAVQARHPVIQQRNVGLMRLDQLLRRRAVGGLGHNVDFAARGQLMHDPAADQRMFVTDDHADLWSPQQLLPPKPPNPPIGGHAIHLMHGPLARQTSPPGCARVISTSEQTGGNNERIVTQENS